MSKTIIRATRADLSTNLSTTLAVEDTRLSWFTKSLFSFLLNLEDRQQVNLTDLPQILHKGENLTRKAWGELTTCGYITPYKPKKKNKEYENVAYIVSSTPR